jgi:hypothetical protein
MKTNTNIFDSFILTLTLIPKINENVERGEDDENIWAPKLQILSRLRHNDWQVLTHEKT